MARDWIKRNNNQGNILRTSAQPVVTADITVRPNANIHYIGVDLAAGNVTLTGVIDDSLPGDIIIIVASNTGGGGNDLILAGDFAAGTVTVGAGGVASVMIVSNGTNFAATVTPV